MVPQSPVSTNRWLRGIKTNRFPWYLTLVSANHALSNPGLVTGMLLAGTIQVVPGTSAERGTWVVCGTCGVKGGKQLLYM